MNEKLITSLTEYTASLEQHIAALETRIALLEQRLLLAEQTIRTQTDALTSLSEQLAAAPAKQEEPEIEVELILDDSEEAAPEEPWTEDETEEETAEPTEEADEAEDSAEEEVPEEEEPEEEEEDTPAPAAEALSPIETPHKTAIFGAPVSELRQAISIGDRFLYQRELFDKNGELMQKTLQKIDELHSFEDALAYINNHFDWDTESTAYELFINALHRRFG